MKVLRACLWKTTIFVTVFILFIFSCQQNSSSQNTVSSKNLTGEELSKIYCGSCHLPPDPQQLTKQTWSESVLPHMSWRMGIPDSLVQPPLGNTMTERFAITSANLFPADPTVNLDIWKKIKDYYYSESPILPLPQQNKPPSKDDLPLPDFAVHSVRPQKPGLGGTTTMIKFNPFDNRLYVADARQQLTIYNNTGKAEKTITLRKVLTDIHFNPDGSALLLSVGNINPNDEQFGEVIHFEKNGLQRPLITGLRRPVDLNVSDLDQDGKDELIICEFGHQVGRITLHRQISPVAYKSELLYDAPGAIKTFIYDLNRDSYPDIVALMAQGNEGVFAFMNDGEGKFAMNPLIRFPPVFGSSDMDFRDINGDSYPDIILVNGDNADYSHILKSFHGIHLYINDGTDHFEERYFYPMYGSTRVVVADFDLDDDLDIAASAFFPDLESAHPESFVYLQNQTIQGADSFAFIPFSFPNQNDGRWMLMEKADLDQDDDQDILLGSSTVLRLQNGQQFGNRWKENNLDFLILSNIH